MHKSFTLYHVFETVLNMPSSLLLGGGGGGGGERERERELFFFFPLSKIKIIHLWSVTQKLAPFPSTPVPIM